MLMQHSIETGYKLAVKLVISAGDGSLLGKPKLKDIIPYLRRCLMDRRD